MAKKEEIILGETSIDEKVAQPARKKRSVWWFVLAAVIVISLFVMKANYTEINDILNPSEPVIVPTAADMQLMAFSPLSNNRSTNVELWFVNIGETPATNISVHVRVRSDNGTVLFEKAVELSSMVLRCNETCTGDYTVAYLPAAYKKPGWHLQHTIEVSWDLGRHTYSKETN